MSKPIYWNDQGLPVSTQFDDIYFSTDNGLAETDYVFLKHNHLAERFSQLNDNDIFVIGETGFGTGLNFLACCRLWQDTAPSNAHLYFNSVEKFPLDQSTLKKALKLWPELQQHCTELLDQYPAILTGFHYIKLSHNITLTLIFDDATIGLQQLLAQPQQTYLCPSDTRQWQGVDAWFLDGFAPAKNPEMWTQALFSTIAQLSHTKTTLATFTAAGIVRRGLTTAGFDVTKVTGYGHKREMLTANYSALSHQHLTAHIQQTTKHAATPWPIIEQHQALSKAHSIAIIGGGIAGCHSAYALANKGYSVDLFEQAEALANGASGNAQGIVYVKLSAAQEPQGDFNLYSLLYAQTLYRDYWQACNTQNNTLKGEQSGVLQLATNEKQQASYQAIAQRFEEHVTYVSAAEASCIANTQIDHPALFLNQAGWICPTDLCQWLTGHPNITVHTSKKITSLKQENEHWVLHIENGEDHIVKAVIIANAYDAHRFTQTQHLPVKAIRGQVSHLPVNHHSQELSTSICGNGYIAPTTYSTSLEQNIHCIGASFNLGSTETSINTADHSDNLHKLTEQVPEIAKAHGNADIASGRVAFRCATPDYLPIVGGVPVEQSINDRYHALSKDGRQLIPQAGDYYSHLYLNIGHGSRGLSYSPLCSEIVANLIEGSPPPVPQQLAQKLNPSRFLIRQLIRSS